MPGADAPDARGRTGLHLTGRDLDRNPSVVVRDVELLSSDWYVLRATTYDIRKSEHYRDYVVLSIEKNRSGLSRIDLQLRKRLEQSRFEREIEVVPEELVDERLFVE